MKGIVFTEYLDFVENEFGYDLVDELITTCDLPSKGAYTAVGSYDFLEMVQLLRSTSERTQKEPGYILQKFGWHLFDVFKKSYPQFFTSANSAFDILSSLDDKIHPEVLKLYPDAELPRFEIERQSTDEMVMVYRSTRRMGAFALGLIEASMAHFGEKGNVVMDQLDTDGEVIRFTIQKGA